MPEMEERQTMEPPPVVIICSIAYLQVKNMPRPSIDMTSSPTLRRGFHNRRQRNDARIGDRDVEPPVMLDRHLDHLACVRRLRHVALTRATSPVTSASESRSADNPSVLMSARTRRAPSRAN